MLRLLSPGLLPFLVAVFNSGAAVVAWNMLKTESRPRRRVAFAIATASTSTLLFLGAAWPSVFTLLAVAAVPAVVGDVAGIFAPDTASSSWFRVYSVSAVVLAALTYLALSAHWFFSGVRWSAA